MRVVIVGAGLMGVTSAWYLSRAGCDVVLIDSCDAPAMMTSKANGGQLSYSYSLPLATPQLLRKIPGILFNPRSTIKVDLWQGLDFYRWLVRMLSNCSVTRAEANNLAVLKLALESRQQMQHIMQLCDLDFDYAATGKLYVYDKLSELKLARKRAVVHNAFGYEQQILTREELLQKEPALRGGSDNIVGAVYSPLDAVGDARKFTQQLADKCMQNGVRFVPGKQVTDFITEGRRIKAVRAGGDEFAADRLVLAAGVATSDLAKRLGVYLPVIAMKGYSITMPITGEAPRISVTSIKRKIVCSRLGNNLRVAGFAEFVPASDMRLQTTGLRSVISSARDLFAQAADFSQMQPWCGMRPVTPDSRPIIGSLPGYDNIYVNAGQGMLGWTLAAGSAKYLADKMLSCDAT